MTSQFTVEDAFIIEGRGLVAAGRLVGPGHGFRAGARVVITRPGGTRLVSAVRGSRVSGPCLGEGVNIDVLLEAHAREDVPRGSVIEAEAG